MADSNRPLSSFLKKPGWLHKPTRSDLLLLIASLVLALFIWVYIATSVSTNYSLSFSDVPITVDISNSRAAAYGLSVVSPQDDDLSVDVTISGSRANIGGMNKSELEAYADFNSATISDKVGRQAVPVRVRSKSGKSLGTVTLSVTSIDVSMDKFQTLEFPVSEVRHPNLTGADDEVVIDDENISCKPATVNIYGPSAALAQIDHLCVNVTEAEKINKNRIFTNCTDYTLVSSDGSTVSDTAFQVQTAAFTVTVPVYYIRRLPVTVDVTTPKGFDPENILSRIRLYADQEYQLPGYGTNNLEFSIKTDDPDIKAELDKRDSLTLGPIPLSSFALGGDPILIDIAAELPKGYTDRSEFGTVSVTFDQEGLVSKQHWISNSEIIPINGPSGYDCRVQSGRTRVTLIGTEEELSQINSSDIKAYVNLFNASIPDEGTFSQAVTVVLPTTVSGVWISPQPKVDVIATATSESTAHDSRY